MTVNTMVIVLESVIGLIIGFCFTDRKRGLSFADVKIASILFLVVSSVLLVTGQMQWLVLAHMVGAFLMLFGGVMAGEYARMHIARSVIEKAVKKDDVHGCIKDFIEEAHLVAKGRGDITELQGKLAHIQVHISQMKLHIDAMGQPEMAKNLNQVMEACTTMARMSLSIDDRDDLAHYKRIGNALASLSLETLDELEQSITKRMSRPTAAVAIAMKTTGVK